MIIAKVSHPIPFRTRSLNPLALMVLRLKARESKSLPDLPNIPLPCLCLLLQKPLCLIQRGFLLTKYHQPDGTWASSVRCARSYLAGSTRCSQDLADKKHRYSGVFCLAIVLRRGRVSRCQIFQTFHSLVYVCY